MHFGIKGKIVTVSLLSAFLCLVISYFGSMQLQKALNLYKVVAEVNFENVIDLGELEKASIEIEAATNLLIGTNTSPKDAAVAQERLNTVLKNFAKHSAEYEALPFVEGEEDAWKDFKNNFWANYVNYATKIVKLSATEKVSDQKERDEFAATVWAQALKKRPEQFDKLISFQENEVSRKVKEASKLSDLLSWLVPLLMACAVLVSGVVSYFMSSTMAKNLMKITELISTSSEQVNATSVKIAASSQSLSQSTTEQAASLEETAASLEEISSMISKAAESSNMTAKSSEFSQSKAEQGKQAVDQMMHSIGEISQSNEAIMNQVNRSNEQMNEIVQVIQEIGNKTKVINEIVFQTKLLSFNASVEAARAGENGKGFAVVAEEVGNLAQMSGNAAKEISNMLDASTSKVDAIVKDTKRNVEVLVEQGKEKVDSGLNVARRCSELLNEIVDNVSKVSILSKEISQASQEQAQGVSEINKAMNQLDTVTQQNASASEAAAISAQELAQEATHLKSAIVDLIVSVQGKSKTQSESHPQQEVGTASHEEKRESVGSMDRAS